MEEGRSNLSSDDTTKIWSGQTRMEVDLEGSAKWRDDSPKTQVWRSFQFVYNPLLTRVTVPKGVPRHHRAKKAKRIAARHAPVPRTLSHHLSRRARLPTIYHRTN